MPSDRNRPRHHLAVHLDEQRIAAGPADRGVESMVELAELAERHAVVELLGDPADLDALGVGRTLCSQFDDRQLEQPAGLEQLPDELLAARRASSKFTSGNRSTTNDRLPRRSITPSDNNPCMASRTEVRATWNCSDRSRSDGTRTPGSSAPVRIRSSS